MTCLTPRAPFAGGRQERSSPTELVRELALDLDAILDEPVGEKPRRMTATF